MSAGRLRWRRSRPARPLYSARARHSPELARRRARRATPPLKCPTRSASISPSSSSPTGDSPVGTVPEADELAEHSDIVLSRHDGFALTIACMIDRETHPGKTFDLSPQTVEDIGKACLKYTGKVNFNKMPVIIQIFEVGSGERRSARAAQAVQAIVAVCQGRSVRLDRRYGVNHRVDQCALRGIAFPQGRHRKAAAVAARVRRRVANRAVVAVADPGFPWLTCAILAALIGVFAAELVYGIGDWTKALQPTIATLVAFGGLSRPLVVQAGEWYRLFSAPLLHGGRLPSRPQLRRALSRRLHPRRPRRSCVVRDHLRRRSARRLVAVVGPQCRYARLGRRVGRGDGAVRRHVGGELPFSVRRRADRDCKWLQSMCCCRRCCRLRRCSRGSGSTMPRISAAPSRERPWAFVLLKIWPHDEPRPRWRGVAAVAALAGLVAFAYPRAAGDPRLSRRGARRRAHSAGTDTAIG